MHTKRIKKTPTRLVEEYETASNFMRAGQRTPTVLQVIFSLFQCLTGEYSTASDAYLQSFFSGRKFFLAGSDVENCKDPVKKLLIMEW